MKLTLLGIAGLLATSAAAATCTSDHDCSLNGVCGNGQCQCDAGWKGSDCGVLDLRPAKAQSGYNRTSEGTSSWGSRIVRDPDDRRLWHMFASEFSHGCGLDYWAPYSRIIRAESRTGPAGPYKYAGEIQGSFAHNPTVVWQAAERKWLMYYIGCPQTVNANKCTFKPFTCGPGNKNNGESGISVMSSTDLRTWKAEGQVVKGEDDKSPAAWDADITNPTAMALDGEEMLLVYRGCPYNCYGAEQINVATAPSFRGPYTKVQETPIFDAGNEDPFVWKDKRGNYHMLLHSLEPEGGFGNGPKVGRHAFASHYAGPWTFANESLAFSTHVEYQGGHKIDFYRRERPQLLFSEDGNMTPLLMTTGVQERGSPMSYTVVVPVGNAGVRAQGCK